MQERIAACPFLGEKTFFERRYAAHNSHFMIIGTNLFDFLALFLYTVFYRAEEPCQTGGKEKEMIKRKDELKVVYNEHMKGGEGTVKIVHYALQEEIGGKCRLLAKIVLEPGCSIGEHTHIDEEEIFYIIKGTASYYDNGTWVQLNEGDSAVCPGGQTHSIANKTDATVEVIATVLLY